MKIDDKIQQSKLVNQENDVDTKQLQFYPSPTSWLISASEKVFDVTSAFAISD